MICDLGFDADIRELVNAVREKKLRKKLLRGRSFPNRRRHPRFHLTATIRLCPRQRAKQLKTCGG
jgi:hypothetical protein